MPRKRPRSSYSKTILDSDILYLEKDMKLFYQLTDEQQNNAIHYQLDIILNDILENGNRAHEECEQDEVHQKLMTAIDKMKDLSDVGDKIDLLLGDEDISEMLHDTAYDMARDVMYAADDEMVVFESEITSQTEEEQKQEELTEVQKKRLLN